MHDSTPPNGLTITLPPELMTMIMSYVSKKQLKNFRLVCRSLDHHAIPLLFDEISIQPDCEGMATSRLCLQEFGPYIKSLTFPMVCYELTHMRHYREKVQAMAEFQARSHPHDMFTRGFNRLFRYHIRSGYEKCYKFWKEHVEIRRAGDDVAHLKYALSSTPRLERVTIADEWPKSKPGSSSYRTSQCRLEDCNLSDQEHLVFNVSPDSHFNRNAGRYFPDFMATVSVNNPAIREIIVKSHMIANDAFPLNDLEITSEQSLRTGIVFAKLRELNLNLKDLGIDGRWQLAVALSAAKHLEHLRINLFRLPWWGYYDQTRTLFKTIFNDCTFPRLRSLELSSFTSTEFELLSFLQASPELRDPRIEQHLLVDGQWFDFVTKARELLHLDETWSPGTPWTASG